MHSLHGLQPNIGRRQFFNSSIAGTAALHGLLSGNSVRAAVESRQSHFSPKAKRVIYLYMSGGMTHLDTFGCVPGADTMGGTKTIG